MNNKFYRTLTGCIILFVTICVIITITVYVYAAAVESYGDNRGAISGIMFVCVAFFSLACTVIDILRRRMFTQKPLEEIGEATRRIAAGDFSVRLPIEKRERSFNEFDYIKSHINDMAASLMQSRAAGEQFIANASHELKTPVAVIQSYASALYSDGLDEKERGEYARVLLETSKKMAATIDNILKLNKIENGKLFSPPVSFSLDGNVAESILDFEEAIERKHIVLECDLEEMNAVSQPEYLKIVWSNLLSNAVKFTPEGGHIKIKLKKQGTRAVFTITDDGCGISKEDGKHIFEKFYQGDKSHSAEGNGLGLAMVKKVIDLLGGEIKVESQRGAGTTFTVYAAIGDKD